MPVIFPANIKVNYMSHIFVNRAVSSDMFIHDTDKVKLCVWDARICITTFKKLSIPLWWEILSVLLATVKCFSEKIKVFLMYFFVLFQVVPWEIWRLSQIQKNYDSIFVLSSLSMGLPSTWSFSVMFLSGWYKWMCVCVIFLLLHLFQDLL